MANLRGKKLTGHNLIVVLDEKKKLPEKDGKSAGEFVRVMLDQSTVGKKGIESGEFDSNPDLVSKTVTGKDGNQFVSHDAVYFNNQIEAMKSAGKVVELGDGKTIIGLHADLTFDKDRNIKVKTPKDLSAAKDAEQKAKWEEENSKMNFGKTTNKKFGKNTLDNQLKAIEAIRAYNKAQRAKEGMVEVETPEVPVVEEQAEA